MSINIEEDCVVDGKAMYCWDDGDGCYYKISKERVTLSVIPDNIVRGLLELAHMRGKKE